MEKIVRVESENEILLVFSFASSATALPTYLIQYNKGCKKYPLYDLQLLNHKGGGL